MNSGFLLAYLNTFQCLKRPYKTQVDRYAFYIQADKVSFIILSLLGCESSVLAKELLLLKAFKESSM